MTKVFISHSSVNNAEAIALRDWMVAEGWSDLFLDLDPERGITAGERWERALNEAARRCEAVVFLISRAWLDFALVQERADTGPAIEQAPFRRPDRRRPHDRNPAARRHERLAAGQSGRRPRPPTIPGRLADHRQ